MSLVGPNSEVVSWTFLARNCTHSLPHGTPAVFTFTSLDGSVGQAEVPSTAKKLCFRASKSKYMTEIPTCTLVKGPNETPKKYRTVEFTFGNPIFLYKICI